MRIARWTTMVLALCCFAAAARAAEQDIAGLKLGMSPDQAKAALKAFGVDPARIQEVKRNYRYIDGVNAHSTPEFLDHISADKNVLKNGQWVKDMFMLVFAPPPKGGQLVSVVRTIENYVDPPTVADYRAAIIEKHGKPDEDRSGRLTWLDPKNGVNCTPLGGTGVIEVDAVMSNIYMGSAKQGWRLNQLRNANKIRDPSDCARVLQYQIPTMPSQPAKRVSAGMVDAAGWVQAYLATLEWIDAQRQQAVQQREGKAAKPKL